MTYGTETWAIKAENLLILDRTERMMVRQMCRVSLKDRKSSVDLYSLLARHGNNNNDDELNACFVFK